MRPATRAEPARSPSQPDLVGQEGVTGHGGHEYAEGHRELGTQDAAGERGQEDRAVRGVLGQVAGVVRDVRAVGELPARAQRDRQQERGHLELGSGDGSAHVVLGEQPHREVAQADDPDHGRELAHRVDQLVAEDGDHRDEGDEQEDPHDRRVDAEQLVDGLARENGAGRGEAEVHHDHEDQRDRCAQYAELGAAGDHLREPETWPLGGVQRHHDAAGEVADEQADDRPERVGAEDDREGAVHDGRDLQVGGHPERELVDR